MVNTSDLKSDAERLAGSIPVSPTSIHKSMVNWHWPRPEGMTMSLIRCDGPLSYWAGWQMLWNKPYRLRASLDPNDWAWETQQENLARNEVHNSIYREKGILVIEDGPEPQWMRRRYIGPSHNVPSLEEYLANGLSDIKMKLLQEIELWRTSRRLGYERQTNSLEI